MSKPRGGKFFTHVQCDYNRCRGREISTGHVADCPFQDTDADDHDSETGISDDGDDEDDKGGCNPVQGSQQPPTQTTTVVKHSSVIGLTGQGPIGTSLPTTSNKSRVPRTSKTEPRHDTTAIMVSPCIRATNTLSFQPRSWARVSTPPTQSTIRLRDHTRAGARPIFSPAPSEEEKNNE